MDKWFIRERAKKRERVRARESKREKVKELEAETAVRS